MDDIPEPPVRAAFGAGARRRLLLAAAGVSITTGLIAFAVGRGIESPDAAERGAEQPALSTLTVPVVRDVLQAEFVSRADVMVENATGWDAPQTIEGIVTRRTVAPGEDLLEGSVLTEINERPVIAVEGDVPTYRDLTGGDEGRDVAQLQAALRRLGYYEGESDGVYGSATQAAVADLYQSLGYSPASAPDIDEDAVDLAQGQLEDARAELERARRMLEQARRQHAANVAAAEADVRRAERVLRRARDERDGNEPEGGPATDGQDGQAAADEAAAALEESRRQLSLVRHGVAVEDAQASVAMAERALQRARAERDKALARAGAAVPRTEIAVFPELPKVVADVAAPVGATASDASVSLVGGETIAVGQVTATTRESLVAGTEGEVEDLTTGTVVPVRLRSISDHPDAEGAGAGSYRVEWSLLEDGRALIGRNVRLTVPLQQTDGPVLAVPASAIYTSTSGAPSIDVLEGETIRTVGVETGVQAGGLMEVRPVSGGRLAADDQVRVGPR